MLLLDLIDSDYSFIIDECNSRLKEKNEEPASDFSQQLSKIVNSRSVANRNTEKSFNISEDNQINLANPNKIHNTDEEKKEKEEILRTLKEKEEIHKENEEHAVIEKENDPNKDLIKKIIEVDHDENEEEENVDDYFSKLEQD